MDQTNNLPTSTMPPVEAYRQTGGQEQAAPQRVVTPPPPKKSTLKKVLIVAALFLAVIISYLGARTALSKIRGGGEVKLSWWGLWEDESVVAPLIAEYQQRNPKVKITYIKQSPQDYRERLTNALARGEGPDIFRFHNTWVPMFREELSSIPASVMTASEFAQVFYPVMTADLTSGAGLVGIPLMYDGLTLYINEEIFERSGKAPPTTWDDLRQLAKQLTIKDEQGTIIQAGIALGRTENVDHWPEILALMMLQNGVSLSDLTGKLAEDALVFFTLFSSIDGVWDASLPPSTIAFASGKLAMYFAPSWRVFEIKQQNPNLRFKTVPLPQLAKGSPEETDISYATYWVEGVWSRSKNRDAAWEFLKFISSRESLEKMYQIASNQRLFGEPYPRTEMASLLADDLVLGSIIFQAPNAQSWYLVSRTFDGPTGINSQIIKYFEDAINAVNSGSQVNKALETAAAGVNQVLSQYGISVR